MPFQLTYHSLAAAKITGEELKEVMKTAKRNNRKLVTTGDLIFHNNFFLQILEGEKVEMLQLVDAIKQDERNEQRTVLSKDEDPDGFFKDWTKAFYHLPKKTWIMKK
jgi:phosphoribosyl-ATP pyrophosphohydrolase